MSRETFKLKFKGALHNLKKIKPRGRSFRLHGWEIEPGEDRINFSRDNYSRSITLAELFQKSKVSLRVEELSVGWRASRDYLVAVIDFPNGDWLSIFYKREEE